MQKTVIALIVAAGSSSRMGGELPKQYRLLGGKSLLRRSIEAFLHHPMVTGVAVVINPAHAAYYAEHTRDLLLPLPVPGGKTRQESVAMGLAALHERKPDYVLIHDAARPNVSGELITRVVEGLSSLPAVIPALPVYDTLKHVEEGRIAGTIERKKLYRAQTPQGFHYRAILDAHSAASGQDEFTDDAAIAENAGLEVAIVAGSEHNYKVTTREDMAEAEALLAGTHETRIGSGFDAHRITFDGSRRHVTLCGVKIEAGFGLEGHSDADAGLHALVDAMLGSIGAGDIGMHFPPSDTRWKDADSARFVTHALGLVREKGGRVVNADITLICEKPHIAPHREAMTARVSELLGLSPGRVSVKATTTEKMGFTGRSEGIAAQAVVSIMMPAKETL